MLPWARVFLKIRTNDAELVLLYEDARQTLGYGKKRNMSRSKCIMKARAGPTTRCTQINDDALKKSSCGKNTLYLHSRKLLLIYRLVKHVPFWRARGAVQAYCIIYIYVPPLCPKGERKENPLPRSCNCKMLHYSENPRTGMTWKEKDLDHQLADSGIVLYFHYLDRNVICVPLSKELNVKLLFFPFFF